MSGGTPAGACMDICVFIYLDIYVCIYVYNMQYVPERIEIGIHVYTGTENGMNMRVYWSLWNSGQTLFLKDCRHDLTYEWQWQFYATGPE